MTLPGIQAVRPDFSSLIGMRNRTDVEVDPAWLALALVNYIIWVTFPVLYFIVGSVAPALVVSLASVIGLLGVATSSGLAYLVYSLVNVRNQHFAREQELLMEGLRLVKSNTLQGNLRALLPLDSAGQSLQTLVHDEGEKSAVLLALLVLIPYFGMVVLIFILATLSRDMRRHESREEMILDDLDRSVKESNLLPLVRRSGFIPKRQVAALVATSVLTLGAFTLFWLYLAIEDVRPHFEYHARFETSLLSTLSRVSTN
jgi:hypothetical protein